MLLKDCKPGMTLVLTQRDIVEVVDHVQAPGTRGSKPNMVRVRYVGPLDDPPTIRTWQDSDGNPVNVATVDPAYLLPTQAFMSRIAPNVALLARRLSNLRAAAGWLERNPQ